jgi:hypothetical protein
MNRKRSLLAAAGLLAAVLVMLGAWYATRPEAQEGMKHITVEVCHGDGTTNTFTYDTDEEYLGALLKEAGLISGSESEYGLFVDTVDGEKADYSVNQSWWQLTCNGESAMAGADQVIIEDGGSYGWIYTVN